MAFIAEKTQLSRETLYRTLSSRGNPTIKTLSAVLKATELKISVSAS
jgi:probable addiction module antidote protein